MSREYTRTRPRGFAPWSPQRKARELLAQVDAVLVEYAAHLPLTGRQIFYRLVGAHGYEKTEKAYKRLGETLNRARRAGLVPWEAIRDDGLSERAAPGFHAKAGFWDAVEATAQRFRLDRQNGQDRVVEVWVEAQGMVPQAERVAHRYGIDVYSSGGFDSVTAKHSAAQRMFRRRRPTVVLHLGDFDPSGLAIFDSAADDIRRMVRDMGADRLPEFRRVAVTPAQIERYALPSAPAKSTDKRGNWTGETVQLEALRPEDLASELRAAIEHVVDTEQLAATLETEARDRQHLTHLVRQLRANHFTLAKEPHHDSD